MLQPLYWDLLCYNIEMLSLYATNLEDESFLAAVKVVSNYMYSVHYSGVIDEDTFLGPSREEHEKICNIIDPSREVVVLRLLGQSTPAHER